MATGSKPVLPLIGWDLTQPPRISYVTAQELARFEIDCRNIVINQVIFPEEGAFRGGG